VPRWLLRRVFNRTSRNDLALVAETLARPNLRSRRVGLFAATTGAGLVFMAVADTGARLGASWPEAMFWIGLLTLFVPLAVQTALPNVPRGPRIAYVVLLGMGLYGVKVLHAPVQFAFGDEYAHTRTAMDILASGRLFQGNPLSAVSPFYPGLEVVTAAISSITGLSIFASGLVVIGLARLILILALYLLVEQLTRSSRVAGLATLFYAGNPNFTFWSAQYAYESLALPLAVFILYLAVMRARSAEPRRPFDIAIVLGIVSLTMTHHLTAYALFAILGAWSLASRLFRRWSSDGLPAPDLATTVSGVAAAAWLLIVAPKTLSYLGAEAIGAIEGFLLLVTGARPIRTLFQGDLSLVSPAWERLVAFFAVALVATMLAVSLVLFVRRLRFRVVYRSNSLMYALAVGALLYFPFQAVRLVQGSAEISNRSGEFLFLPMGLFIAILWHHVFLDRGRAQLRLVALSTIATLVFMGGVIVGIPRWARLPGSYLVSGDTRAIQDESLKASAWLRDTFGPNNRLIADQTNQLILGSLGDQTTVHGLSWVYFVDEVDRTALQALTTAGVRFIVVDRRLTTMLPISGSYYENGEPNAGRHTEPITPGQLDKFDETTALRRVFDSGNIAIFELQ
jgi:hypothetical protein